MIDKRALKSVAEDLADAARRLESVSSVLDGRIRKRAQDEPPVEPPAEEGGGFEDEGTTGEEGGGEEGGAEGEGAGEGDLGDLGDLGGGGGGGGFGGAPLSGGFGADTAAEGAGDGAGDEAGWEKDMAGLRSEIEGVKRTLVNVTEVLRHIRDPLADPARGNDAMQSV